MTGRPAPAKLELHSVDLTTWDDGDWADSIFSETYPDELDEPWPYRFKVSPRTQCAWIPLRICLQSGEIAWVCAGDGEWYRGKVVGQAKGGKTRSVRNSRMVDVPGLLT